MWPTLRVAPAEIDPSSKASKKISICPIVTKESILSRI